LTPIVTAEVGDDAPPLGTEPLSDTVLVTWHSANGCAASTSTSSSAAARGAAAISCARGRGTRQRRVGTRWRAWHGSAAGRARRL
jgi:hypothetical protein